MTLQANGEMFSLAEALGHELLNRGMRVTVAESCTGGGVAASITDVAGSSAWFERGFVTYSNRAKTDMLGVPAELIDDFGAVSGPVVERMLEGALKADRADLGVAISGIAGPGGGSDEKPVGTVWFAWGSADQWHAERYHFPGSRAEVRAAAVRHALSMMLAWLRDHASR